LKPTRVWERDVIFSFDRNTHPWKDGVEGEKTSKNLRRANWQRSPERFPAERGIHEFSSEERNINFSSTTPPAFEMGVGRGPWGGSQSTKKKRFKVEMTYKIHCRS
jgi:hypothetical protein